jgi:hypothetical protein
MQSPNRSTVRAWYPPPCRNVSVLCLRQEGNIEQGLGRSLVELIELLFVARHNALTRSARQFVSDMIGKAPVDLQVDCLGRKLSSQHDLGDGRSLKAKTAGGRTPRTSRCCVRSWFGATGSTRSRGPAARAGVSCAALRLQPRTSPGRRRHHAGMAARRPAGRVGSLIAERDANERQHRGDARVGDEGCARTTAPRTA